MRKSSSKETDGNHMESTIIASLGSRQQRQQLANSPLRKRVCRAWAASELDPLFSWSTTANQANGADTGKSKVLTLPARLPHMRLLGCFWEE